MESNVIADSKVVGGITDGMDRISDLPPFIIHHIMSYLNPEDIAKTSVLSKRWQFCKLKFRMQKFRILLSLAGLGEYSSILGGWICSAVQNGVQD
ncbi:hypothetical protein WN944_022020 [Citrus x changshan-huyou]|uniref:F-box domain-containing protein n=1 Tax=Citrus x changshan-huyou TaxID=2935761 RepID=A0AAP0R0X7_9ROSI